MSVADHLAAAQRLGVRGRRLGWVQLLRSEARTSQGSLESLAESMWLASVSLRRPAGSHQAKDADMGQDDEDMRRIDEKAAYLGVSRDEYLRLKRDGEATAQTEREAAAAWFGERTPRQQRRLRKQLKLYAREAQKPLGDIDAFKLVPVTAKLKEMVAEFDPDLPADSEANQKLRSGLGRLLRENGRL